MTVIRTGYFNLYSDLKSWNILSYNCDQIYHGSG